MIKSGKLWICLDWSGTSRYTSFYIILSQATFDWASYSEVVQKSATKARAPPVPKPLIPSTTKSTSSTLLRIADSGKGKGKARQSPEPYVEDVAMGAPPKFDMAAAYKWHALYDDDDWSDNDVVHADPGDILKMPTSEFGRTVHGILQGLHVNSEGALGSTLVEGVRTRNSIVNFSKSNII